MSKNVRFLHMTIICECRIIKHKLTLNTLYMLNYESQRDKVIGNFYEVLRKIKIQLKNILIYYVIHHILIIM